MSRIDDLIAEHCPDGVEFKRLGDIVRIKNGKDHKLLNDGEFPVYGSGGIMRYADTYAYNKPSVLIPRKGSLGNLFFVDVPFWNVDTIFYTEIDEAQIRPKFLYYFLTTVGLGEMNQAGGVPSQTQSVLNELEIPVPQLEVQREIVRILDTFTSLTAELTAELTARKKQYNYYRDQLLSFEESEVEWKTLGEIGTWYGGGTPSKSNPDYWENGTIPWVSPKDMGRPLVDSSEDYITEDAIKNSSTKLVPSNSVAIVVRSSILDKMLPSALIPIPVALNQDMKAVIPYGDIIPGFFAHMIRSRGDDILRAARKTGGSVASIESKKLFSFRIPVPCPKEQKRIVNILDKFDTLANSISEGLPREIELRQKQYAYYRDLLLSFPKPEEVAA